MSNEPIGFRFSGIQILSKNYAMAPSDFDQSKGLSFTVLVETRTDEVTKIVSLIVFIKILYGADSELAKPVELASFSVAYYFEISDFEKVILKNEDNAFIIPQQLDSIIKPASISTTRGIIYSELRGTYLHQAIMPIVFIDNFSYGEAPEFKW